MVMCVWVGALRETRRMTEELFCNVEGLFNKICRVGVEVLKILGCHKMSSAGERDMGDSGNVVEKKFV
jgi:hypothetical protein